MKVLIVAKTRRNRGACVGGITEEGRSVRLISTTGGEHAGMEYEVGDVWELDFNPEHNPIPPHVENVIVYGARRLKRSPILVKAIHRFMPPVSGGPEKLFGGLTQSTGTGSLYVADRSGLPNCSTMFWIADKALKLDCESKRIRYRYSTSDGGRTLTFVGFQQPIPEIPAGTLLRVSLAHRWRPDDKPEEELRCFVQLSGWYLSEETSATLPKLEVEPQTTSGGGDIAQRARHVLKQTFGFSDFLPVQREAIARVLQRKDTLVVMPTGGGKSLCYQLPALLFEGLTVVVSPLIALMQDQVNQLRDIGVAATFLNSTLLHQEYISIASMVRQGHVRILYVAPETLLRPETLLLLEQSKLTCLAVDEAHCISEWGHDFRPEYRQIHEVRRRFPQAVCLALTATATQRVREDIGHLLNIPAEGRFIASFNRRNLFLAAEPRVDGLGQVLAFLEKHRGQSGIIYCGTRKQTDEVTAFLNANGWPALAYHAGLQSEVRRHNQDQFIQDDAGLMVATIAFGMGINKSNIRFIVHYHLPKNLEGYYQEIGRAGRDGLPADCLLLHNRSDAVLHRRFIKEGAASERAGREERLSAMQRYAETRECRRTLLLAYFGERWEQPCGYCDKCLPAKETGETKDVTLAAQKLFWSIAQTGELFGLQHIVAVLRGSRSAKVLERRHDQISTYGAGKELSPENWRELARELIERGFIDQDLVYGSLKLSAKGREALNAKSKVLVSVGRVVDEVSQPAAADHDEGLFQRLRELRRELANEVHMPAFYIFADRTLVEMATVVPQDETELLSINGVGEVKLAKYGKSFLQAIREYCQAHAQKQPATTAPSRPASRPELQHWFFRRL